MKLGSERLRLRAHLVQIFNDDGISMARILRGDQYRGYDRFPYACKDNPFP